MTTVSKMTNFQKVQEFHTVFGHPNPSLLQLTVFESNPKLVELRLKLIKEEFNELIEAVEKLDLIAFIDALGDLLYVLYGMGSAFGINLDVAYLINVGGSYIDDYYLAIAMMLNRIDYPDSDIKRVSNFELISDTYDYVYNDSDSHYYNEIRSIKKPYRSFEWYQQLFKIIIPDIKWKLEYVDTVITRMSTVVSRSDLSKSKKMKSIIDDLCICLKNIYSLGVTMGINLDSVFDIVHRSNMSKLCKTELEAMETIEHYKILPGFDKTEVKYRLAPDSIHYVMYNALDNKILKSRNFKLPDFMPLFEKA